MDLNGVNLVFEARTLFLLHAVIFRLEAACNWYGGALSITAVPSSSQMNAVRKLVLRSLQFTTEAILWDVIPLLPTLEANLISSERESRLIRGRRGISEDDVDWMVPLERREWRGEEALDFTTGRCRE